MIFHPPGHQSLKKEKYPKLLVHRHSQPHEEMAATRSASDAQVSKGDVPTGVTAGPAAPIMQVHPGEWTLGPKKKERGKKKSKFLLPEQKKTDI